MKNSLLLLLFCLLAITGFSQNSKFTIPERQTPTFNKQKLNEAKLVTDLTPFLWSSLRLQSNDRYFLDNRRISEGPQPEKYQYPQEKYKEIIDYVLVEITATCNGKALTAKNTSDQLTEEQKNILSAADLGANISVKIKYKYKDQKKDNLGPRNTIAEGIATVALVPETEAEFPGGFKQLSEYFIGNVIEKASDKKASEKIERAEIKFTVNEEGEIVNAKLSRATADMQIDQLIIEALNKMPKWKPAVNANGVKVKQDFVIPFSVGC